MPQAVSGLVLRLDASQLGLAEGAGVGAWPDASGSGHDAAQSSAQFQPKYVGAGLGGRPAVRFDGVDDYLSIATTVVSGSQARTIFIVARPSAVGKQGILDLGQRPIGMAAFTITPEYGVRISGGYRLWTQKASTSKARVLTVMLTGTDTASILGWANGALLKVRKTVKETINTAGSGAVGTWTGRAVGQGFNFGGEVAEILVYNRSLSTAERQSAEAYLASKYGIVLAAP